MKKSCIVGYGAIGPFQAQIFKDLPNAKLYAICDNDPAKLEKAAKDFPDAKLYSDYDEALKDAEIEVIHVCTPHYLHLEMVEKALAAGKDVLLEKPVCISLDEFEKMKEAEAKSNNVLSVVFQNRTNPSTQRMLEEMPKIGKILGISARLLWHKDEAYYNSGEWRGKWATEGGGLLINQAIHTLDLLGYLAGGYTAVTGSISTKKLGHVIEVEDTADALMETVKGIDVIFSGSNCYPVDTPIQIEITGEKATLRFMGRTLYKIQDGKTEELVTDGEIGNKKKSYWGHGHRAVLYNFYQYLETGQGYCLKLGDTENTMKALFAFYKSAKINERVEIK